MYRCGYNEKTKDEGLKLGEGNSGQVGTAGIIKTIQRGSYKTLTCRWSLFYQRFREINESYDLWISSMKPVSDCQLQLFNHSTIKTEKIIRLFPCSVFREKKKHKETLKYFPRKCWDGSIQVRKKASCAWTVGKRFLSTGGCITWYRKRPSGRFYRKPIVSWVGTSTKKKSTSFFFSGTLPAAQNLHDTSRSSKTVSPIKVSCASWWDTVKKRSSYCCEPTFLTHPFCHEPKNQRSSLSSHSVPATNHNHRNVCLSMTFWKTFSIAICVVINEVEKQMCRNKICPNIVMAGLGWDVKHARKFLRERKATPRRCIELY